MKKAIILFFLLTSLFLTACNTETPQTSDTDRTTDTTQTTTASTSTTETTSTAQTSDTTEKTEVSDTTQTTETTVGQTEIPEVRNPDVVLFGRDVIGDFFETPMGIAFSSKQKNGGSDRLAYYVPEEGKAYIYCFDPTCDHSRNCVANGLSRAIYSEYDDRLYSALFYYFESYSRYAMDKQVIDRSEIAENASLWSITQYENYIYLRAEVTTEDESYKGSTETHIIRYNIDDGTIVDLTEKTGFDFHPSYFYDGYIYGSYSVIEGDVYTSYYGRTDLDFENFEPCEPLPGNFSFSKGTEFFGVDKVSENECGIKIYDVATGEVTVLAQQTIGRKVLEVVAADENYIYFLADETYEFYDAIGNVAAWNSGAGKIYRINRDGTNRICVYDDNMMFFDYHMYMYVDDNVLLTYAEKYDPNTCRTSSKGIYIGKFDKNGKIEKLKWLEYEESVFLPLNDK